MRNYAKRIGRWNAHHVRLRAELFLFVVALAWLPDSASAANVYPERSREFSQSLDGQWSFKYIAGNEAGGDKAFTEPGFDASAWKKIRVPGNWELQGFAEPHYDLDLQDGLGLYRRTFEIPQNWLTDGRRVFLRFEGVAYGFNAWVNGKEVGQSSASAYNPHTFDITDAVKTGKENTLAVQVSTKPFGYEFDVNDDWALGGICRDVTVFSRPQTYLEDISTSTKLAPDGAAELRVSVAMRGDGDIRCKLVAPDGKTVQEFGLDQNESAHFGGTVRVEKPQLWTAETPSLYRLQLTLSEGGKPVQTAEERIGLREISIKDSVFLINGRPVKLRGVDHHDMDPVDGRAITEAEMRRDLELMKKGNMNFVRTSHYPPQPRFIELCDEMGMYVMCEVAIGKGEEHLDDPKYRHHIVGRVRPTITRDKNRPSVIVWSIGNENPVNEAEMECAHLAKELDPTRPVCIPKIGSYFEKNYGSIPAFVDIYAPHYPSNATLRKYAQTLKRPLILTEYAHALGLATDRIQDQWEMIQVTPGFAGGAVWMFQDQGILRKSDQPADRSKPTQVAWIGEHRYYDSAGLKGADGLVYSDRTPQTDYWQTRKVYSPVQIAERSATVRPGPQTLSLTIENRHDFRSLEGMNLAWVLRRNGEEIQKGEAPLHAASRAKETAQIVTNIPADAENDILALDVRCLDEKGQQITERGVRLNLADTKPDAWLSQLSPFGEILVADTDSKVEVGLPEYTVTVSRADGKLSVRDRSGRTLVDGIYPHVGRGLTMAESLARKKNGTWEPAALTRVDAPQVCVTHDGASVVLSVSGTYPRPMPEEKKAPEGKTDDPLLAQASPSPTPEQPKDQSLAGGYTATIAPSGVIEIRYDYQPKNASGHFTEAGLSVAVPAKMSEFRWIGQGPYAGYPGKDRLNEFGIFHLNREDLRFRGNRRGTEVAMLTTPTGAGVAMVPSVPSDVSLDREGECTLLSHNAVISGLGNKGAPPETNVDADKVAHIAGSFRLLPLGESTWPSALGRWFGKPSRAKDVFKPFYHSYDE